MLGNCYFTDSYNYRVRRITPDGKIMTVAGTTGISGYTGDGGPASQAKLQDPLGVTVDTGGRVYISDDSADAIRLLTPERACGRRRCAGQ